MKINFKDKKTRALLLTAFIALISSIGILSYFLLTPGEKPIEIPDFSTWTVAEVQTWIEENELDSERVLIEYEFDEEVKENMLISQTLAPSVTLDKDSQLTLLFSKGYDPNKEIILPDFTGMREEDIDAWFAENKFSDVTYEYIPDEKIEKGLFISSNITTTSASRSDLILVSISVGTESVGISITVPDFSSYTRSNIQAWAKTNNISVTFSSVVSNAVDKGAVVSQKPVAGSTMETGGKLTITLSLGKGIAVNNLAGKTKSEIDSFVSSNKLKVVYQNYYSNSVVKNTAISSSPSGTVSEGSTITVKLSIGKPSVNNYTGKSLAQFKAYIQTLNGNANGSANLSISVVEKESSEAPGTILAQIIGGNTVTTSTEVDAGSTITVHVAKEKTVSVSSKANTTESSFKTYIEGLGLVLGTKTEKYSTTISSGNIISNDTGTKSIGAKINYVVSLGSYNPTASSFNGKTLAEIKSTINNANQLGAGWSVSETYAYNNDVEKGLSYNCSINSTKLSCIISNGSYISVSNKAGTSESSFLSYISSLGLKAEKRKSLYSDTVAAGSIIWNTTGTTFTAGNTIEYDLSLGAEPLLVVPSYSLQLLSAGSYDSSVANVQSTFAGFTNLKFVAVTSDDTGQPDGLVLSISVAAGAKIPPDTEIIVQIIKK